MQAGTEPERQQLRKALRSPVSLYGLQVNMPVEEAMHGFIPQPIELLKGGGVPPILIELPICKLGELPKDIGDTLKDNIEQEQLQNQERHQTPQQQLEEANPRPQLNPHDHIIRVDDVRRKDTQDRDGTLFKDILDVAGFLTWVGLVVDQRGHPHVKGEVVQVHVVGVR